MPSGKHILTSIFAESPASPRPIRVVIADDSRFMRKALRLLLQDDPEIEVVGVAKDGYECLGLVESLRPDVLTLDLNMPLMNGVAVLRILNREFPLPVIMISSLTVEGAETTLEALELGAIDYIAKQLTPKSLDIDLFKTELVGKVKWAVQKYRDQGGLATSTGGLKAEGTPLSRTRILRQRGKTDSPAEIVGIGASTGGPVALQKIIPMLPLGLPVPVVVAQHIPLQFSESLVHRLSSKSQLPVKLASQDDRLVPGTVLVVPGGTHLEVASRQAVRLVPNDPGNLACPSVNRLLSSMADSFGPGTLALILTGMGNDGLEGVRQVQDKGGQVFVQDESTCMAFGMPKSVVDQGLADREVPLDLIATEIVRRLR